MDYSQYTLGRVVKHKGSHAVKSELTDNYKYCFHGMYGHITGFALAEYDAGFDTIIMVKWADDKEYSIHPNGVELL